jgi:hypothetical protein
MLSWIKWALPGAYALASLYWATAGVSDALIDYVGEPGLADFGPPLALATRTNSTLLVFLIGTASCGAMWVGFVRAQSWPARIMWLLALAFFWILGGAFAAAPFV